MWQLHAPRRGAHGRRVIERGVPVDVKVRSEEYCQTTCGAVCKMPLRLDHRPPEGLSAIEHLLQPGSRAARLKLRLIYDRVECNPSCDFSELMNLRQNCSTRHKST